MASPVLQGVLTALVTPFKGGKLDEAAFAALVERQVAAGVHGLAPVGTTGETATLSHAEHARVVALCVEVAARRVPVVAGSGANATPEVQALLREAKAAGADAALVVAPYYNRPSQEGLFRHYQAVAETAELPIVVYNVPSRTGVDIATPTMARISALPNIAGVKDATGDLARPSLMRLECQAGFTLLSGDDPSALGYVAHGGRGVISVTSNVAPEACARQMEAALAGDFATALAWQDKLIALHRALFLDASPAPTKFALAALGLCEDEVRLPIAPCDAAVRPQIERAMRDAGLG